MDLGVLLLLGGGGGGGVVVGVVVVREREKERESERERYIAILAQIAYIDFVTFGVLTSSRGRVRGEGSYCAHEIESPPSPEQ